MGKILHGCLDLSFYFPLLSVFTIPLQLQRVSPGLYLGPQLRSGRRCLRICLCAIFSLPSFPFFNKRFSIILPPSLSTAESHTPSSPVCSAHLSVLAPLFLSSLSRTFSLALAFRSRGLILEVTRAGIFLFQTRPLPEGFSRSLCRF